MDELGQWDATIRIRVLEQLPDTSLLPSVDLDSLVISETIPLDCRLTLLAGEMVGAPMDKAILLAATRFVRHIAQNLTFPDPYFGCYLATCADNMLLDIPLDLQTYRSVRGAMDREAFNYWTGRFL